MDLSQVERLKEQHKKEFQQCEDKINRWKKFKTDYETLKQRLETFPNELSYEITVPFGPNAFTIGELVHTNEIMVLLGDNWFANVSAKQAVAIIDRRIGQCLRMLNDLSKEKQQFENWLSYIDEVSNNELVEIVEEYDEEKERKWREQHSRNVKAYRERLSAESKNSSENVVDKLDHECLANFERLELMETPDQLELSESEELTDEVPAPTSESEEVTDEVPAPTSESKEVTDEVPAPTSESEEVTDEIQAPPSESEVTNQISKQIETSISEVCVPNCGGNNVLKRENKPSLKLNINCTNNETALPETESCDDDCSKSDDMNSNVENCNSESMSKHVRWQDQSKQSIKKITFKHSKSKHHSHCKHQVKKQDSSDSNEPQPIIQSPSDIYKHFGSLFQATSPKSILKVKNSPSPEEINSFFPVDEVVPKDHSPMIENIAFTGKVYEKNSSPIHITENKSASTHKMSHFKSTRKSKKRLSH